MTAFYCTNCEEPSNDPAVSMAGNKFCYACSGYSDALAIGDPRVIRMMLYVNAQGVVVNWPNIALGHVTHKTLPVRHWNGRTLQPVRYKVLMLDGSRWYGTGPTASGDYIRLTRYKGQS